MNEDTVFIKTKRGREELRTRALKLPAPLRSLLIAVDGIKSVSTLSREYPVGSGIVPLIRGLVDHGLIEPETKAALAETHSDDSFERFRLATQFLNEATALLGIAGFFFSLRIQRCANLSDLRALTPEFRSAVTKRSTEP